MKAFYHIAVLLVALLSGCAAPSFLDTHPHGTYDNHPDPDTRHTWQCVTDRLGKPLDMKQFERNGQRYLGVFYDRNEDRKIDMALVYEYTGNGGVLRPFPARYILLENGKAFEYVDLQGNGRCADIVSVIGNEGEREGAPAKPRATPVPKYYEVPADPNGDEDCKEHEPDPKEQA